MNPTLIRTQAPPPPAPRIPFKTPNLQFTIDKIPRMGVYLLMLPRRNSAESSRFSAPNPRAFILLRTLCPFRKSQTLWNQANTSSCAQTPGWGWGPAKLSSKISDLQTLLPQPVCKSVTPGPAGIDLHVPCFHTVTNPSFRKSFIFTSICIAPCFFLRAPSRSNRSAHSQIRNSP